MVEIERLSFGYKKRKMVFEDISLTLKSGIYGILGENGVGKTTLLHLISGLRFPQSGSCKVIGYDSSKRNVNMLSQLFFLPEEFQMPSISIEEYAKCNSSFYPRFSNEQFEHYLEVFQIEKNHKMADQSLGQKKKAMIAFALALNTPILLLDEPTNGLDIPSKRQLRKLISSVADDGRCIVISTHQIRDLENLIDPVVILDNKQILINHSVEEITQRLFFSYSPVLSDDALYYEELMQGYLSVRENENNEESNVNLEALFSTVVSNKERIKKIFNS